MPEQIATNTAAVVQLHKVVTDLITLLADTGNPPGAVDSRLVGIQVALRAIKVS